jgi:phosphate-selective porin OprO/OprP
MPLLVSLICPALADAPSTATASWGQGVTVSGDDLSLQIRARAQLRAALLDPGAAEAPLEAAVAVRRMRITLLAKDPSRDLQLYVQLGLAPQDMESDLLVPLRDAVVTWSPLRDLGVKAGQMKVPFNRERVVSSGALQFVDRSVTNAALNLDRDVGVQLYSDDLLGLGGRVGYQLAVYNGDGRNRFVGDTGLLYVARLDVRPLGPFDDLNAQADLDREGAPRLDVGAAVARNVGTVRERSTTGDTLAVPFTYDHGAVDLVFKARGVSLHAEGIARRATQARGSAEVDGVTQAAVSGSAWGASVQGGYVFPGGWEPVARCATVQPIPGMDTSVESEIELRGGLNWYVQGHDLKLQLDVARLGGDAHPGGDVEGRLQAQVFF